MHPKGMPSNMASIYSNDECYTRTIMDLKNKVYLTLFHDSEMAKRMVTKL